jgi:hypothetical protein
VPHDGAVEGSAADRRSSSASSSDTEDRNYYPPSALDALGLKNGCSAADVKAAYRKLVKDVHPDRDPSPEVQHDPGRCFLLLAHARAGTSTTNTLTCSWLISRCTYI